MTGETDLTRLLADMNPQLDPEGYVFAVVPYSHRIDPPPLMRFREAEGDTVILTEQQAAKQGIEADRLFCRITLHVHSDLEAVGLTAAFAACLTDIGISANVVAGYYHDHIFVPTGDADRALAALRALSRQAQQR